MKKSFLHRSAVAFSLVLGAAGAASANVDTACTPINSATVGGASTADYQYRGDYADSCFVYGSDNNGPTEVVGVVTYYEVVKVDLASSGMNAVVPGTTYDGLLFDLDGLAGGATIDFSLRYIDFNQALGFFEFELLADDNPDSVLPGYLDLMGVTKQGNIWSGYLFDNALLDDTGNFGKFRVEYPNAGNQTNNAFSHFSIYASRSYTPCIDNPDTKENECDPEDPPNETPEPSSIALFGLALAGLGLMRRRRS